MKIIQKSNLNTPVVNATKKQAIGGRKDGILPEIGKNGKWMCKVGLNSGLGKRLTLLSDTKPSKNIPQQLVG